MARGGSLYELSGAIVALTNNLENLEEIASAQEAEAKSRGLKFDRNQFIVDQESEIQSYIQSAQGTSVEKLNSLGEYARNLEAQGAGWKKESDRLSKLASGNESRVNSIKSAIRSFMSKMDLTELSTPLFKFRRCTNGGGLGLLYDKTFSIDKLTDKYVKEVPDEPAIKLALQQGVSIPGVRLSERGEHVRF